VLRRLVDNGMLRIKGIEMKNLCRERAWIIVFSIWHQRKELNPAIKSSDESTQELCDYVHSLGTARVAVLVAVIASFILAGFNSDFDHSLGGIGRFATAVILSSLLFVVYHSNYGRVARLANAAVDQCLCDALQLEIDRAKHQTSEQGDCLKTSENSASVDELVTKNMAFPIITWPCFTDRRGTESSDEELSSPESK